MTKELTGVVLAAGMGTRLGDLTKEIPKALIEVGQKSLIYYAIKFLQRVGVDRIVVVGGFHFNKLEHAVHLIDTSIEVHENKDFKKGNLYTLDTVLDKIDSGFLMINVDHIYHKSIAEKVGEQLSDSIVAFTDNDRKLGDDDMKILVDEEARKVTKISKQLDDFQLGYVGMTYTGSGSLTLYKRAVEESKEKLGEGAVVEDVLQFLADKGEVVRVGDISGYGWHEIDFPHELDRARKDFLLNKYCYI